MAQTKPLEWTKSETIFAKCEDGTVYTVAPNPFPETNPARYVALRSVVMNGRFWEHLVGFYNTHYQAITACNTDAKG